MTDPTDDPGPGGRAAGGAGDADRDEFVEAAAQYFAGLGLSRTSGRVLGLLLSSATGSADAVELCAALGAAKSSVSVALRQLDAAGLVERYREPRGRRDRYRLTDDVFGRSFRAKMAEFAAFRDLADLGMRVVGDNPAARERLQTMADMYAFMATEFPKLLTRWERHRTRRAPRS